jgi:hypothetical protein
MSHAIISPSNTAIDIPTASPIVAPVESLFDCESVLLNCASVVLGDGRSGPVVDVGVAPAVALSELCHQMGTPSPLTKDADVAVV